MEKLKHTNTHTHACTHSHARTHTYARTHTHTCTHKHTHTCTHKHTHVARHNSRNGEFIECFQRYYWTCFWQGNSWYCIGTVVPSTTNVWPMILGSGFTCTHGRGSNVVTDYYFYFFALPLQVLKYMSAVLH